MVTNESYDQTAKLDFNSHVTEEEEDGKKNQYLNNSR